MDTSEEAVQAIDGPRSDEAVAEDRSLLHGPGCGKVMDDVDMENLFSGNDDGDDDMESLFGSLDDDTEETSLASPTSFSIATPLPPPLSLPLPLPTHPLPLPALPSSSAAAVPADWNSFCDVSTTLPESNHEEEDGQRARQKTATEQEQQGNGRGNGKGDAAEAAGLLDSDPSGFDINLDLGDFEFDFNLDIGSFTNGTGGAAGNGYVAGAPSSSHADIGFDFGLDADAERQLARELGLELEVSQAEAEAEADKANTGEATPTPSLDMTIDTCFFDATGLAGSTLSAYTAHTPQSVCGASTAATTHNDDQEGHGRRMQDGQEPLGSELDFDFDLFPQDALAADQAAAPGAVPATTASTAMAVDTDTASDDVVILYEQPARSRFVPTSASELAEIVHSQSKAQPKATQPAIQLLSPASEPLSQPSSRQASEEASPAPTIMSFASTVSATPAPTIPASLQASIPHYLELRPRCPQIPPPKRIDLGEFNVEELLPYVQLHSKLSMVGIQQMLGLDIDAGRLVVGECRRYLADPAHRVAPSGTSDPAALRTLKVALIQSSLVLLKYGENGAHLPQNLQNGVGERWFSRSSSLEPRSMHLWPDDSTTLVLLFIQLLYRLTRNNSVRERQRKASALRKAQNQNTPPHSPCPNDAGPNANTSSMPAALQPRAKQQKRAPRFSSKEASTAKHPRLSPPGEFPLPNSSFSSPGDVRNPLPNSNYYTPPQPLAAAATVPRAPARPLQPILAYNSPRVLRDDLILSASRKPPAAANIRYIVNVVDRGAQRLIPQVVLSHDGPIRSAGYSHLAKQCARILGDQHAAASTSISIMTPLGLERVGNDADWDRVVCRVHDDMIMDREVRVLISLGAQ